MTHFPHRICHRQTYILPTPYGFIFLLTLILMLIGSVNYKNNLGFLLTFLLLAMTFISMFVTYLNLLHIEIKSYQTIPVFAGESMPINLLVRSTTRRAAIRFAFLNQGAVTQDLYPMENRWLTLKHATRHRGLHRPKPLSLSTRFPFGLFRAWTTLNADIEYLVYPRPISGRLLVASGTGISSAEGTAKIPGVDDFEGLKLYQPGDSMQHISWKAYSSGQGLYTKEFTGVQGRSVMLDWSQIQLGDMEKKISRLCDMVLKAHRHQMEYGLILPQRMIAPGKGLAHRNQCLRTLATFGLKGKNA